MIVKTEGHVYELQNFEDVGNTQTISFIKKEPVETGSANLKVSIEGTINEEVLAMLIDRINFLQKLMPCRENAIVITKLEECLMWLNKRTGDRRNRGVEGTNNK